MTLLRCLSCQTEFPTDTRIYTCTRCEGLLDIVYGVNGLRGEPLTSLWDQRRASPKKIDQSGVWRFREMLPEADEPQIVTMIEGNTQIFDAPRSADYAGIDRLAFKHLGMNPTGSFKDLGMTTGITQAGRMGAKSVACASTGNTSASMAAYAARAGMKAFVFIPSGQVSLGKLSQALDYGAVLLQIEGDFDDAMRLVREVASDSPLYLLNSVNPFRLEGQKTIAFEMLQQRGWKAPHRIVVPGGNLGNSSAIAKGFHELEERGVIEKMPKVTIVQAEGANPLYRLWLKYRDSRRDLDLKIEPVEGSFTLATAIKIGSPISWPKAIRALQWSDGEVEQVSEQEIADAKAVIGRDGIGCEPASAVTLAGIRKMVLAGAIKRNEDIVAILTGHVLKDPDYTVNYHSGTLGYLDESGKKVSIEARYANAFIRLPAERDAIIGALKF
jgi:threonine synthase